MVQRNWSLGGEAPRNLRAVGAQNFEKYSTFLLGKRDFPVIFPPMKQRKGSGGHLLAPQANFSDFSSSDPHARDAETVQSPHLDAILTFFYLRSTILRTARAL